jgi:LysM repeat protein
MRRTCSIFVLTLLIITFSVSSILAAGTEYIVKSGDSLWLIAQNSGKSVNELKQINGLTSDFLSIGQKLILTSSNNVTATNSTPAPKVATGNNVYVVQPGDSLWQISLRTGISVDKLKELNSLTSDLIFVGQKLNLGAGTGVLPSRSGDNVDGSRIVAKAAQYLGTQYVYGGQSPSGFDCSGFVYYIFQQFGYSLP